uniref:40S ribosomal protein S6 n=1 Tax=Canis lupus familiaris TaxID=9615 RepID=A0A8C0S4Q6_CANLF
MKLNISLPATSCQKLTEVDGEHRLHTFYEKYMAIEVAANALGEEWKVYGVQISDGDDKQGFPMKQGVHLLLSKGHSSYRPRRTEQRRCKSVQGCRVNTNLSIPNLVIVKQKKGGGGARAEECSRLTDTTVPCVPGPKENSRICKLFNLSKEDVICQYVMRKALNKEGKKPRTIAPKIQHPVTQHDLQHKCWHIALKKQCTMKNMEEAAEYAKLLAKRMKEAEETHQQQIAKSQRLSSLTASTSKSESSQKLDCLRVTNKYNQTPNLKKHIF